MKIVQGDLIQMALTGHFDVIINGSNCFCTMGKGFALSIKNEFPEAYEADRETAYGNHEKLGSFSYATVYRNGFKIIVVNAYTQYDYWGQGVKVDYEAVESCFKAIREVFPGLRIGYPKIGAGLAGGDWQRISGIIDDSLIGEDHTLVEYNG